MNKLFASLLIYACIVLSGASVQASTSNSFPLHFSKNLPVFSDNLNLSASLFSHYTSNLYQTARLAESGLDSIVFKKAVTGFYNLMKAGKSSPESHILTVVDYTKSSRSKRMWIIDLKKMQLMLNTWVAHGQGSGDDIADRFSNEPSSFQSSLGFYVTGILYHGKHGRSLRLNGMDAGFNDRALARDIVLHAAAYVSESSIQQLGRLGRSQGCPAVSFSVINEVINLIKDQSVIFVNGNDLSYNSKYLDESQAASLSVRDYLGTQPGLGS